MAMSETNEFLEDAEEIRGLQISDDNKLKRVSFLADKIILLDTEILDLESQVKAKETERRKIAEQDLPDAMKEIGLKSFELSDGTEINVKEEVFAGIPEQNREACFSWLRENGFGDLIKNEIKITLGMGEDDRARFLKDFLLHNNQEGPFDFDEKTTVLAQTLKAFVREQDKKGRPIPENLFSVHRLSVAKLKRPKK
jgi:hypothetical protein